MRLVIAAALTAASSDAAAAPPPPPPPVGDTAPAAVGGYSTDWMNSAYRWCLRAKSQDYALAALQAAIPKSAGSSETRSMFALHAGPRVSFFISSNDGVDHYAFHYTCPRLAGMPAPHMAAFQAYLAAVRDRCAWQVDRVRVRFRQIEGEMGEAKLRPDFALLARLLRRAGVPADPTSRIPDTVFAQLGSPEPLFARAISLASISGPRCPAISVFLADLDRRQVQLDLANVAADRIGETPPVEASSFRIELPVLQGGNCVGKVTLTDHGSGLASDSWRALNERIEPCLGQVS